MTGKDNVRRLMEWRQESLYPDIFRGRPHSNNAHVSRYTVESGIIAPVNNLSHTNLVFLVAMANAENGDETADIDKKPIRISIGGTVNECICEVKNMESIVSDVHGNTNTTGGNYEVAIYNENTGNITAFIVDGTTNKITAKAENVSFIAILGSLWDALCADEEFYDQWMEFTEALRTSDIDTAWDAASVLSDNMYRRILNENITISSYNQGLNDLKIEQNLARSTYAPSSVTFGAFDFLSSVRIISTTSTIKLSDFVGKYQIDKTRIYTEEEEMMMKENELEEYYIIDNDDVEICTDILKTTNTKKPFRNFIFVGPPGSGKSNKAKAIANGIKVPEVIHTCNPSTEIFDIIGQVMPPSRDELEKDAWAFAAKLEELGGINYKNVASVYGLPDCDDILQAPEEVYTDITGLRKTPQNTVPTVNDTVKAWTEFMAARFNESLLKLKVAMKEGAGFKFTETDFIRAIENGWLIEVQEPNVILNEGVMVGLNSILNEGVITLQTGRTVHRHRDSVVIFTTNHNLYGLRNMNQSFLDRSAETFFIEKPPVQVVADRIMSISGCTDRTMVMEMAKLGESIANAMDKEGIEDGVCGMRSLINWAIKASYTNPYDAAIKTVINKTSLDAKSRNRLLQKLDESYFYQFKGR